MSNATVPYLGSKITLVSNSEIRYEGILHTINTVESTVALQYVRSFGTEGRVFPGTPPSHEVYDFIIFRGRDIKDLTVCEAARSLPDDPAIVSLQPTGGPTRPIEVRKPESSEDRPPPQEGLKHHGKPQRPETQESYPNNEQKDHFQKKDTQNYPPRNHYQQNHNHNRHHQHSDYDQRGRMRGRLVVGELPAERWGGERIGCDFAFERKLERGAEEGAAKQRVCTYDKTASFFDNLSCEALDKSHEDRHNRDKLNCETFGYIPNKRGRGGRPQQGGFHHNNHYPRYPMAWSKANNKL